MVLTTVSWGSEISWSFGDCSSDNAEYGNNAVYDITCTLAPGAYWLSCIDSYGDGWHGGNMAIDGVEYCGDFTSGHSEEHCVIVGVTSDTCDTADLPIVSDPTDLPDPTDAPDTTSE